ncbi:MAG TPA: hypothetical protein VIL48_18740 [Acidimicrobiales bacterium]
MIGAIALAVVLVIVLPVAFLMSGAVVAALLGQVATLDAEARHEGSELIALNK